MEEKQHRVNAWLSKLAFKDKECLVDQLSGGWKKRLAIAAALIKNTDLLVLDEPTNHLDLKRNFLVGEISSERRELILLL